MRRSNEVGESGTFIIEPNREVFGTLKIAGKQSELYLHDRNCFQAAFRGSENLTGTLHDLTRVTLIGCLTTGLGHSSVRAESYHFARIFPHYVVTGTQHLDSEAPTIQEIIFIVDDAPTLFYDIDAFGTSFDARPHVENIVMGKKLTRKVKIGEWPQLAYFTGKVEIVSVETTLGKVAAQHNPSGGLGGPCGVRIDNRISVSITTSGPGTFAEAISRMLTLLRFFAIVVGRPQVVKDLWVVVAGNAASERLRVHWNHAPTRDEDISGKDSAPQPADILLDPVRRPAEFTDVMRNWLAVDRVRRDARVRFASCFEHENVYPVDRIVGAANMFDILPPAAVPKGFALAPDIVDAKRQCDEIFRNLPASQERSSVLDALGRLGMSSLRRKVRHRAANILSAVGYCFPELESVIDEAVNCRNHYVHGSLSKIDCNQHFAVLSFFIDTLEFVFAASELIEAGWNIREWVSTPTSMSHPFGRYRVGYAQSLAEFKAARTRPKAKGR